MESVASPPITTFSQSRIFQLLARKSCATLQSNAFARDRFELSHISSKMRAAYLSITVAFKALKSHCSLYSGSRPYLGKNQQLNITMNSSLSCVKRSLLILIASISSISTAAEYPPNIDYGQQGDFITKRGTERGRTAILQTMGPILLNLPEKPGTSADNIALRNVDTAWDLQDLSNPRLIGEINCDANGNNCDAGQGIHAHGVYTRFVGGQGYLLGNFGWQGGRFAFYDPAQPTLREQIRRTGATGSTVGFGGFYSGMTSGFNAKDFWIYNTEVMSHQQLLTDSSRQMNQTEIEKLNRLGIADQHPAWKGAHVSDAWDHLGLTGVTGFSFFSGNLMLTASDQQNTGLAIYDIANLDSNTQPTLLSVFNPVLTQPNDSPVGIGGYWVEPYGANKVVYSARSGSNRDYPAMYIVDFEDPRNPELTCELYFDQDRSTGKRCQPYFNSE